MSTTSPRLRALLLTSALLSLTSACTTSPTSSDSPPTLQQLDTGLSVTMPPQPRAYIERVERNIEAWDSALEAARKQLQQRMHKSPEPTR